ncbi:MAG: hypothetical protein ACI8PZ_005105 [Myxococcota bacterium]|jgi:hypothetical protein
MTDRYHDAYQPQNVMGRDSEYLNRGLWSADTTELDEACRALALAVGDASAGGSESPRRPSTRPGRGWGSR